MASEVKHTPGPWHCGEQDGPGLMIFIWKKGQNVCVAAADSEVGSTEQIANANLIASSPDLLAACEAFLSAKPQCECTDEIGCKMASARAKAVSAISKAKGTS